MYVIYWFQMSDHQYVHKVPVDSTAPVVPAVVGEAHVAEPVAEPAVVHVAAAPVSYSDMEQQDLVVWIGPSFPPYSRTLSGRDITATWYKFKVINNLIANFYSQL